MILNKKVNNFKSVWLEAVDATFALFERNYL